MEEYINSLPDEDRQRLIDAVQVVADAITKMANKLMDAIKEVFAPAVNAFIEWLRTIIAQAPQKVLHLAYHAKKRRVRKKNMVRILRC